MKFLINKFSRKNLIAAFVIAILFGFFAYFLSYQIDDAILWPETMDSWFEADIFRVASNMSLRHSNHYRTRVHPLFSIVAFIPTRMIALLLQTSLDDAVRIVSSLIAAVWGGIFFLVFRGVGCQWIDSLLFILLAGVSSASIFWLSVPETYVWGSITILMALGFTLLIQEYRFSWYWYTIISAITFSMTITNWMVGLLVTLTSYPGIAEIRYTLKRVFSRAKIKLIISDLWGIWKKFFGIQLSAIALVLFIALIQRGIFPTAALNFFTKHQEELDYIAVAPGGRSQALTAMIMHTIIMPEIQIVPKSIQNDILNWPFMLTQVSNPGSASIWGSIAVGLWLGLLILGVWSFFRFRGHSRFRFVLGLTLLGQFALHHIYGSETFLYSLHIAPLLLLIVSFVSLTSFRPFGLTLAGCLILVLSLNNLQQFQVAADYFKGTSNNRLGKSYNEIG